MRPNWRNADEYPRVDNSSPCLWAWEFLRRNPQYIKDWTTFKASIGEYADRYPNFTKEETAKFLIDNRYQHVVETGSTATGNYRKTTTSLMNWYGRKWGLMKIADPDARYDQRTHRWIDAAGLLNFPHEGFDFDDPRYMAVAIDLTLPLDDQLDQVREHYELEKAKRICAGLVEPVESKRARIANYRDYLRVLDGYASGAQRRELASILLPHVDNADGGASKNIDNWRIAAERMSKEGYRKLPLLPE